jgi:hypothetical protein
MAYDLMLLADPGTERERVLRTLREADGVKQDPSLDNRFWLTTPQGEIQINMGTKDPVESVHVEFEIGDAALAERATLFSLDLGKKLDMRVEDMQYLHEIDESSLPALRRFWSEMRKPDFAEAGAGRKPWWRPW